MSKQKKYHFIYRTTCVITNKFYVGMHSTDNLEDGYLGSGKILGYSLNKHGRENHKLEILEHCQSREELRQKEKQIVNEEMLLHPRNMNLKYGGEGGWDHQNSNSEIQRAKCLRGIEQQRKLALSNPSWSEAKNKKISKANLANPSGFVLRQSEMTERARSVASIKKRKSTFAEREHMQGEKNSNFGKCWVTNGVKPISIFKEQLDEYIRNGYSRGRKISPQ